MILYKLTFQSGKSYIGQTVRTLETRVAQHNQAANAGSLLAVHCAWRVHGKPSVETLGLYETADALHDAEIAAIAAHGTMSPSGYNLGHGGETAPSKNPEVAAKIAAKAKGRLHGDDAKAAIGAASASKWQDEEYRAKVVAGVTRAWTPERRLETAARAAAQKGAKRSPEICAKMRLARANTSDATRAKMSASAKARVREAFTPETCVKISAHVTASWQDPDIRLRRSAAIRAAHQRRKEAIARGEIKPHVRTPEHAAAISAALQRRKQMG